jgi:hypothetical protein
MVMRYFGGGVGHKSAQQATQCLFDDRDVLDRPGCNAANPVPDPDAGSGDDENDCDDPSSELEFPHSDDSENDDNMVHSKEDSDSDERSESSERGEDSGSESEQTESDSEHPEDDGFAEY